jgi:hypothetical protein
MSSSVSEHRNHKWDCQEPYAGRNDVEIGRPMTIESCLYAVREELPLSDRGVGLRCETNRGRRNPGAAVTGSERRPVREGRPPSAQ